MKRCTSCSAKYDFHNGHRCGFTTISADQADVLMKMRKHRILWWLKGLR